MPKQNILYVPLDDRPVNADFPLKLLKLTAFEALTPPRNYLGRFTEPGAGAKITEWLVKNARNAQSAVVSLDMLSFGGLFHSRKKNVTFHGAFSRLQRLKELKKKNPSLFFSAFSVMLRLTISVENEEDLPWWEKVFQYAVLTDKAEREGKKEDKEKLEALLKEIPGHLIEDFMEVRTRNHNLQLKMIEWVKDGVFDMLVFSQEDAHEFGLHRKEREALEGKAKELGVLDKILFVCGADEIGACLLTREVLRHEEKKLKVFCFQDGKTGWNAVSLFEDRSIGQTFDEHVALCGLKKVSSAREADIPVFLHLPRGEQKDLCFLGKEALELPPLHPVRLNELAAASGSAVAMGDIAYCNGADPNFIKDAGKETSFTNLLSFSAWNTTSNTIGTLLSHAVLVKNAYQSGLSSSKNFLRAHVECLIIRFLEDYVYSTLIRPRINEIIKEELGVSIWNFGARRKEAQEILQEWFLPAAYNFYNRYFHEKVMARRFKISGIKTLSVKFPWDRTFEISVDVSLVFKEEPRWTAGIDKRIFLPQFEREIKEQVQIIINGLLSLEREPQNREILNEVFRQTHTIKGSSTMMRFYEIRDVAHEMENVLDAARNEKLTLTGSSQDVLFQALDCIMRLLESALTGAPPDVSVENVLEKLRALVE